MWKIAIPIYLSLVSCVHTSPQSALNKANWRAYGNEVCVNDKLYAEIKFLREKGVVGDQVIRGIAIYYPETNEEKWICPQEGWVVGSSSISLGQKNRISSIEEIKKKWNGRSFSGSKSGVLFGVCMEVAMSEDGKKLFYTTPTLTAKKNYEYDILEKRSRRVSKKSF